MALAGCGGDDVTDSSDRQTITGIPLSVVSDSYASLGGTLATVIDIEDKKVLGYSNSGSTRALTLAVALIQSEISDGDNEQISLTGHYVEDRFAIESVRANGYTVDLD